MIEPPAEMRVVDVSRPGGPEVLQLLRRPTPHVSPGEVLIKVAAAGLNRADLLQRRGVYPPPPGTPNWPGMEVAGTIAAVAPDVTGFKPGDAVCALLAGGGYAEYCVVPPGQVLPLPAGLDMVQGAALPEAYFTVWSNVFELARLQAGQSFLVHGGASGIGTAAIQLARARGATVFATAGSDERCALCRDLGAHHAINYRNEDFVAAVRKVESAGVDVILDMVGGDYLPRNVEALAPEGRLVIIAVQAGARGQLDMVQLMRKRALVTGTTLRNRPVAYKAQVKAALLREVWPLLENGTLKPVLDRVYPLDEVVQAHARMEEGAHAGKIILRVG